MNVSVVQEILRFLRVSEFMPHSYCLNWDTGLVWLHVVSDGVIALAYFSIPVALLVLTRKRRDLPFAWMFYLFGAFIVACGATHLVNIWNLWFAHYQIEGVVKAFTAALSIATAIALYPLTPKALALRSPAELEETNASLQAEIGARERAEKQLPTSEERFDLAVQGSNDGLWDWDILTDREWWSPRFYGLLGYEVREIEASYASFQDMLHPEDKDRTLELVRAHLNDHAPYDIEFRLRRKSGEYRWFSARGQALWDASGKPIRMAGSIRDITDRKKAEQALRDSESRLLLALEALDGGVWDWNVQTGEVHFTESWFRMLGYEPGEIEEHVRTWENALHPDEKPAVMKVLNDHFEGRSSYHSEHRMRTKSGGWIWVLDRGKVVERDKNGKPLRMTGTDMNVTDRRQVEEEKRRLEAQVQHAQKLESLGVLAGGIAHDFNNILTPIMGFSTLVEESLPTGSPNRESLKEVVKSSERAKDLVRQILAFSRRGEQERKPVDIAGIVKEAMKLLRATIPTTIEIRQSIHAKCGRVWADLRRCIR